ncbi:MAG: HEAT repeat domain-containing protein [Myxococcota bacterium]
MPNGAIQVVPAHRVVNVATDPDLREPTLAGILHRFENGDELAVPFVYHDPDARKLALVLPPSLRHRELSERARLLEALAADAEHPIPTYARHFAVVVGVEELAEYLALPAPAGSAVEAARREAALRAQEQELAGVEAELRERARELEGREQALDAREQELAAREAAIEAWRGPEERPPGELVGDEEVEEVVDDLDGLEEVPASAAAEPADDAEVVAEEDVQEVSDPDEPEAVDAGELAELVEEVDEEAAEGASAELRARLADPEARPEAALRLCRAGASEDLEAVRRVLGQMTPDEVAGVCAALVQRGDDAGDVLIRSLRAPEPYVRHGAALALGEMAPQRAVLPLVRLVREEPEDLWQEAARVLGGFGEMAMGTLRRSLERADGLEERLAYALAALAEGGCDGDVRSLRETGRGPVVKIAKEAMALREVVRAHGEAVRGEAEPDPGDAVRAFSRRFYEALGT